MAMLAQGFEPDWPPRAEAEPARPGDPVLSSIKDLCDFSRRDRRVKGGEDPEKGFIDFNVV